MAPSAAPNSAQGRGSWRPAGRKAAYSVLPRSVFDVVAAAYVRLKNSAAALARRRSDRIVLAGSARSRHHAEIVRLHGSLVRRAAQRRIPIDSLERDFAMMHLLIGIAGQPELADVLALRGGAALRWLHVPCFRPARDLDLTVQGSLPSHFDDLLLQATSRAVASLTARFGQGSFEIGVRPGSHLRPDVTVLDVTLRLPWRSVANPLTVSIETEPSLAPLLPPVWAAVFNDYGEGAAVRLRSLRTEECLAQKLETLLTISRALEAGRGAARSPVIDYYDLADVLGRPAPAIDHDLLVRALASRCERCGTSFSSVEDFFAPALVAYADSLWRTALADVDGDPGSCRRTLGSLRPRVAGLLSTR